MLPFVITSLPESSSCVKLNPSIRVSSVSVTGAPGTGITTLFGGGELQRCSLSGELYKLGFAIFGGQHSQGIPTGQHGFHHRSLALLQVLLIALRAYYADGCRFCLALGIEELGRDVVAEVESNWMVPLLVEEERGQADELQ